MRVEGSLRCVLIFLKSVKCIIVWMEKKEKRVLEKGPDLCVTV